MYSILPARRAIFVLARCVSAGSKWEEKTSPGGATPVATQTLKACSTRSGSLDFARDRFRRALKRGHPVEGDRATQRVKPCADTKRVASLLFLAQRTQNSRLGLMNAAPAELGVARVASSRRR